MPDTPKKQTFLILKPQIKTNPKDTICHVQKPPTIFHKFSVFFNIQFLFLKSCLAENTIKIVFSGKHSFSKTQLVKPTVSPMSKEHTFFQKKVSFLLLGNFRWNHYFYSFSWFTLFWAKKIFWPKQIVCTKMRVFSPFLTQIVSANFCKTSIFWFFTFLHDHLKKPIFIGFFGLFHFLFFFFFLFLGLQHKKRKKQKMQFSFRKPHFWHPPNFAKTLFWHTVALFVFLKMPKKHYKTGEKQQKNIGPVFNTRLGPVFNTRKGKSWTSF